MDVGTSREHRVRALAVLTACGSRDDGHTAQLVLLAVLLKEVAGPDRTMAAVAESLFAGVCDMPLLSLLACVSVAACLTPLHVAEGSTHCCRWSAQPRRPVHVAPPLARPQVLLPAMV